MCKCKWIIRESISTSLGSTIWSLQSFEFFYIFIEFFTDIARSDLRYNLFYFLSSLYPRCDNSTGKYAIHIRSIYDPCDFSGLESREIPDTFEGELFFYLCTFIGIRFTVDEFLYLFLLFIDVESSIELRNTSDSFIDIPVLAIRGSSTKFPYPIVLVTEIILFRTASIERPTRDREKCQKKEDAEKVFFHRVMRHRYDRWFLFRRILVHDRISVSRVLGVPCL